VKGTKLILLFLIYVVSFKAQSDTVLAKAAGRRSLLKLGKNALLQKDAKSAIVFYETYLKKYKKKDLEAMTGLGFAYMEVRNYDKAQHTFLRVYKALKLNESKKYKASEVLYFHALMQKSNGLYDSAKTNFSQFKKEYKGDNKALKKLAAKEIVFCDSVHKLVVDKKRITIQRLDTSINKVNTEGSPIVLDDFTMVFSSLRTETEVVVSEDTGEVIKRKLYMATKKNGKWKYAGEFDAKLNSAEYNTSNACFNPDRTRLYFTRCKPDVEGDMICAIYMTEKKGDQWQEPVKLPKSINNPKYSSTMPAVTIDPVKGGDIIYFVTNKKGGKGGQDIWYTIYNKKNNTYRVPKNAGTKINSTRNELSPYFDLETQSLYFSSDGWGGLGGYDIFKATGDGKRWLSADNIGQPINTGADELYFTISPSRRDGFFVSNRKGGNTLKNATCCDDIYAYYNNEYVDIILKGNISELLDPFDPVANATIELFLKDAKTNEKFLVKTALTDAKGNYSLSIEPGQDYYVKRKIF
jgi:OmpA-OmpF porin, OOP family